MKFRFRSGRLRGRLLASITGDTALALLPPRALSPRAERIAAALRRSGYTRVDSRPVETPFGLMQADIAHAS